MISGEDEYVFRTAVHIFNAERLFLAFHCIIQEKGFCCFIIADGCGSSGTVCRSRRCL
ncbi:hypothetical protein EMIT074MI3_20125 [Bacillus licheniformis]